MKRIFEKGMTHVMKQVMAMVAPTSPYQPPVKSEYLPPPISQKLSSRLSFLNFALTRYRIMAVLTNMTVHILLNADNLTCVNVWCPSVIVTSLKKTRIIAFRAETPRDITITAPTDR